MTERQICKAVYAGVIACSECNDMSINHLRSAKLAIKEIRIIYTRMSVNSEEKRAIR